VLQSHGDNASVEEEGARLYIASCSACHGTEGNSITGVDFRSGKFRHGSSDYDLMLIVLRGVPGTAMPANSFNDSELKAIVGHLRSMQGSASSTARGDTRRGWMIFEGPGACLDCHPVNGKGSYSAIDLSDIGTNRSIDYLERSLVDPSSELPEHRAVRAVKRNGDIILGRHLNEDTFTVQLID